MHQLIIAKPRDCPADPHEEENEECYFTEHDNGTDYRDRVMIKSKIIHEGEVVSSEVKGGNHRGRNKHIDVFCEQIEAELHTTVFGVISTDQFRFAFCKIKRCTITFCKSADQEYQKTQRLINHVP